jgi:hypothetical protein
MGYLIIGPGDDGSMIEEAILELSARGISIL